MATYTGTGGTTSNIWSTWTSSTSATASATMFNTAPTYIPARQESFRDLLYRRTAIDIPEHWGGRVNMPDGSFIEVDAHGNYQLNDDAAKVIYRANRIREFNRYLNASDLLEEFIREVGRLGVRQHQVTEGLFGVFLHWLILRAADQDQEEAPPGVFPVAKHPGLLAAPSKVPRCRQCGRFVKRKAAAAGLPFCDEWHMAVFWQRHVEGNRLPTHI